MTPIKKIALWLFTVAFMVFAMAVIGAITRLTESGLSIAEWNPLMGALPPLSESEWTRLFDLYKHTPEYEQKNIGMTLTDFKTIFFWEWVHRLWGRLIGLALLLPLVWFAMRRQIPQGCGLKILGIGVLIGLQGLMGWIMVQSGLVDRPSVSHIRLAAHLLLAFTIFGSLLWLGWSLWGTETSPSTFCRRRHGWSALALLLATVTWGAFTAGLDAGLLYNTYPLMDGHLTPAGAPDIIGEPGWVQFTHRWLAAATALTILAFSFRLKSWPLGVMSLLQITLGIATLLTQVHLPLAAAHQAGALILFALLLFDLYKLRGNAATGKDRKL